MILQPMLFYFALAVPINDKMPAPPPLQCAPIVGFEPTSVNEALGVLRCWELVYNAKWGRAEASAALNMVHYVQERSTSNAELVYVSEIGVGLQDENSMRILQLIAASGSIEAIYLLATINLVLEQDDSMTTYLLQQAALAGRSGADYKLMHHLEKRGVYKEFINDWRSCLNRQVPGNPWVRICQSRLGSADQSMDDD